MQHELSGQACTNHGETCSCCSGICFEARERYTCAHFSFARGASGKILRHFCSFTFTRSQETTRDHGQRERWSRTRVRPRQLRRATAVSVDLSLVSSLPHQTIENRFDVPPCSAFSTWNSQLVKNVGDVPHRMSICVKRMNPFNRLLFFLIRNEFSIKPSQTEGRLLGWKRLVAFAKRNLKTPEIPSNRLCGGKC